MDAGFRHGRGIPHEFIWCEKNFEGERKTLQALDIDNHSVKSLYGQTGEDRRDRRRESVKPNETEIAREPPDVLGEEGQWDTRSIELLR
jgi:hypothetical protein